MASVERIIDEGLLIALSAVRMAVKNHIIVGALRDHRNYDRSDYAATAKAELHVLARQNEEYAARVARLRKALDKPRWGVSLTEDERGDLNQLALRRLIHERLTIALDAVAADDDQVARLVEQAQQDAGQEISDALAAKLIERVVDRREPHYEQRRAERTRALISIDLAALISGKSTTTER